jgi:hypothetical protein
MIFTRWLPFGDEYIITVDQGNMQIRLWLNRAHSRRSDEELLNIHNYLNPGLSYLSMDVLIRGVPDELIEFVYSERDRPSMGPPQSPDERYTQLRQAYADLGQLTLATITEVYNRLIGYCRYEKGQHWLEPLEPSYGLINQQFLPWKAQVRAGDREWIRWYPSLTAKLTLPPMDASRFISKDDWPALVEFVRGDSRPSLVRELLANADALADTGFRRSAIIEAVAALEVSLSRFARGPKMADLLGAASRRVDTESLVAQIGHLGLSGSVRYLLPLFFGEVVLPTNIAQDCWRAIDLRGNLVHEGQRDVDEGEAQRMLPALRQLCEILDRYTEARKRNEAAAAAS